MSNHTEPRRRPRLSQSAISLWASALVILALVIVQAGRLDDGHKAFADVALIDDLTIMNADAGGGEEVVVIIDAGTERIFVYSMVNRAPELVVSESLSDLFLQAKAVSSGGR
jgi:hypothetical protein